MVKYIGGYIAFMLTKFVLFPRLDCSSVTDEMKRSIVEAVRERKGLTEMLKAIYSSRAQLSS